MTMYLAGGNTEMIPMSCFLSMEICKRFVQACCMQSIKYKSLTMIIINYMYTKIYQEKYLLSRKGGLAA